ncbi:MAG: hypothetical protein OER21_03465 [Gemmatimonadota bacterium]|nr:hypothetical protein [Gemmatimonadota bacterium]
MSAARRAVLALIATVACGGGGVPGPLPPDAGRATADDLPPVGYGTLKLDDIALLFETGDLRIRVLPLDERVIRLLAPDSYESLHGLKRLRAAEIDSAARSYGVADPSLFSVSFYGLRERAQFTPEELTVQSRGRFFRPFAYVPLSPRWGERQAALRESAVAVALYESGMALFEDELLVSYQGVTTRAWGQIARVLNAERAAALSRAAAAGKR